MRILVIDDDPSTTELLYLLLVPASPDITAAINGIEGIRLVKETCPEVIILDMMMPEMNGKEVCEHIREFSSTPILILSALDTPGLVADALDAGADDYLIKPVSSGELIAHINKLLRRIPLESISYVEAN
jgi:DNA-binding response OmpR family regulator